MNLILPATFLLSALLGLGALAAPLDEPAVSRVVNEVQIVDPQGGARRVTRGGMLRSGEGLRSGAQARAELQFSDGTLARLGAGTVLGFRRGARELSLAQGTLLLEVPGFRGGARIRLGGLTAVCGSATILVEHLPSRSVKLVVLEGDLRLATGRFLGDSLVIRPGRMLITAPDAKELPDPVDVDLATLIKTSALIDSAKFAAGSAPLASLPRIQREIGRQAGSIKGQRLIETNLAIIGSGTNLVIPGQPGEGEPEAAVVGPQAVADRKGDSATPNPAEIALQQKASALVDQATPLPEP